MSALAALQQQTTKLYHGTSWENAQKILRDGFEPSERGSLGRGVYLAPNREKAVRYARNEKWHGSSRGAVLEVTVRLPPNKVKHVVRDDKSWAREGYEACRAQRTRVSHQPEYCVADPKKVRVASVKEVPTVAPRALPNYGAGERANDPSLDADDGEAAAGVAAPSDPEDNEVPAGVFHPGVTCDATGGPIYGTRWHLAGEDYDLCDAAYRQLVPEDRELFVRVDEPHTFVDWDSEEDESSDAQGHAGADTDDDEDQWDDGDRDAPDQFRIGYTSLVDEEDCDRGEPEPEFRIGYASLVDAGDDDESRGTVEIYHEDGTESQDGGSDRVEDQYDDAGSEGDGGAGDQYDDDAGSEGDGGPGDQYDDDAGSEGDGGAGDQYDDDAGSEGDGGAEDHDDAGSEGGGWDGGNESDYGGGYESDDCGGGGYGGGYDSCDY